MLGVLPDGVRLFDRLTGEQLITYAGLLQGLDRETVAERTADLLARARPRRPTPRRWSSTTPRA